MLSDRPASSPAGALGRDDLRRLIAALANPDPDVQWRAERPREPQVRPAAEIEECRCPDFCNRDHSNE